jgi:hypothetical protein
MMPLHPTKRPSATTPARRRDPALTRNLAALSRKAYQAGASAAYVVRDPQSLILRDGRDELVETEPATTVMVLLFASRDDGELALEALPRGDVIPTNSIDDGVTHELRMPYFVSPGYTEEEVIQALEKAEAIIEHLSYQLVTQGIYPETLQNNVVDKQRMIADVLTRARWNS